MSILCDAISIPIFIFFIKSPLWKFQYGILLGDRKGHVGITRFLQSLIMLLFHFFFFSWKCSKHQLLLVVSQRAIHQHIGWGILPRLYGKHCSKKNYDVRVKIDTGHFLAKLTDQNQKRTLRCQPWGPFRCYYTQQMRHSILNAKTVTAKSAWKSPWRIYIWASAAKFYR